MKLRNSLWTVLIVIGIVLVALTACSSAVSAQGGPVNASGRSVRVGEGQGWGNGLRAGVQSESDVDLGVADQVLAQTPVGELSEVEAQGLLYMREEEKLARDVYLALDELWGVQTFANIAGSEATHMDAVLALLDRYGLADPTEGKSAGEFANQDLQALYNQLVDQGSQSLVDALQVGAAIEEIDIVDLQTYLAQTDQADIQRVYESLMRGSENHLRAFVSSLERQGVAYEPTHLSPEAYEQILNAEMGRGGGQGGQGSQSGQGNRGSRGGRGR